MFIFAYYSPLGKVFINYKLKQTLDSSVRLVWSPKNRELALSGIFTELVVTITTIQYQFSPPFLHGIFAWFLTIPAI